MTIAWMKNRAEARLVLVVVAAIAVWPLGGFAGEDTGTSEERAEDGTRRSVHACEAYSLNLIDARTELESAHAGAARLATGSLTTLMEQVGALDAKRYATAIRKLNDSNHIVKEVLDAIDELISSANALAAAVSGKDQRAGSVVCQLMASQFREVELRSREILGPQARMLRAIEEALAGGDAPLEHIEKALESYAADLAALAGRDRSE